MNIEVGNFWNLCINRLSHIINWRCSEYNSTCSHYACQCKQPQKQPIQNHCNKFPILYYLLFFRIQVCRCSSSRQVQFQIGSNLSQIWSKSGQNGQNWMYSTRWVQFQVGSNLSQIWSKSGQNGQNWMQRQVHFQTSAVSKLVFRWSFDWRFIFFHFWWNERENKRKEKNGMSFYLVSK